MRPCWLPIWPVRAAFKGSQAHDMRHPCPWFAFSLGRCESRQFLATVLSHFFRARRQVPTSRGDSRSATSLPKTPTNTKHQPHHATAHVHTHTRFAPPLRSPSPDLKPTT
ncbi:hypothetical protein BCR44DRAFT_1435448 [Catenaria anguillulae PL171]|uniref:Uncharacterized protein n=1 Tax=Catenaria anguillulae PL171 TaxID=765915 RepID=A0A1Y2HML0_9FUNG|nr:hypothetical protein BCR44DRAFT_1435448 [Catenaria anguillulae PL171]